MSYRNLALHEGQMFTAGRQAGRGQECWSETRSRQRKTIIVEPWGARATWVSSTYLYAKRVWGETGGQT